MAPVRFLHVRRFSKYERLNWTVLATMRGPRAVFLGRTREFGGKGPRGGRLSWQDAMKQPPLSAAALPKPRSTGAVSPAALPPLPAAPGVAPPTSAAGAAHPARADAPAEPAPPRMLPPLPQAVLVGLDGGILAPGATTPGGDREGRPLDVLDHRSARAGPGRGTTPPGKSCSADASAGCADSRSAACPRSAAA